MKYDLEDRTKNNAVSILKLCKKLKVNLFNENIIKQVLRSSQSVAANYLEANGASSKRDFRNKIHLCKKESKETEFWIHMLTVLVSDKILILEVDKIIDEAHQITLIFNKIASSLKILN